MPQENVENQALKQKDLVFILAIAGRIDAQSRILAKRLDNERHVYYGYAALDSLSSSYSMFKYFFEMIATNNDADHMHDVMLTPGGIVAITTESIFLVAFSLLACKFDGEKNDAVKKFIAAAWPYFRDVIKGLKNAYKGWRSAMQALGTLSGADLRLYIVPIGLLLGIFAAGNRLWIRNMVENRKAMMSENAALLIEIKQLTTLDQDDFEYYLKKIKYQSLETRHIAFVAVAGGGTIDGLYLYVGVLSLAALTTPVFTAMTVMSGIFTLACIITRVFEEYDFQVRLFVTQTKCRLALITKEIETRYTELLSLNNSNSTHNNMIALATFKSLQSYLGEMLEQFEENRELLHQQSTKSHFTAGLLGLKNGLYAYSALASILFLIGTIITLSSAAFPPALLIFSVSLGMLFIIGFTAHGLWTNYSNNTYKENHESTYSKLIQMGKEIKNDKQVTLLEMDLFKKSLRDGLTVKQTPQSYYQEWFEVVRSFFSGVGKGQKFIDFSCNPMQEADDQGHYHDTPVMFVLAGFSAALFAFTLALRALARGLGRPPLAQVELTAEIKPAEMEEDPKQATCTDIIEDQKQKPIESIQSSSTILDAIGLFGKKAISKSQAPTLIHSSSTVNFVEDQSSLVQGLA